MRVAGLHLDRIAYRMGGIRMLVPCCAAPRMAAGGHCTFYGAET